jgi:hypothetical protein
MREVLLQTMLTHQNGRCVTGFFLEKHARKVLFLQIYTVFAAMTCSIFISQHGLQQNLFLGGMYIRFWGLFRNLASNVNATNYGRIDAFSVPCVGARRYGFMSKTTENMSRQIMCPIAFAPIQILCGLVPTFGINPGRDAPVINTNDNTNLA